MEIRILGCSGGIGGDCRTTALLVDKHSLIDCGTGAGELDLEALCALDRVFLTHSHMDHIALLPMLADARVGRRDTPLLVHALPETLTTLRECVFNGRLWPDYTQLPHAWVRLMPLAVGETVAIDGGEITALPACHAIPAVGYRIDSGQASLAFSGDSTECPAFWEVVNDIANLSYLLIETTFLDDNEAGCAASGHHNARRLTQGLQRLRRPARVLITHMEPGREAQTWREIMARAAAFAPQAATRGMVLTL